MTVALRSTFTAREGRLAFINGKSFVYRGRHPEHDYLYVVDVWTGSQFINNVTACADEIFLLGKKG